MIGTGTPEEVAATPGSYTGDYLSRVLAPRLQDEKRRGLAIFQLLLGANF